MIQPDGVCEGFVLGQCQQAPFDLGKTWRVQQPLELFHSDLNYMNKLSLVGEKYIITFIDDYSKFT